MYSIPEPRVLKAYEDVKIALRAYLIAKEPQRAAMLCKTIMQDEKFSAVPSLQYRLTLLFLFFSPKPLPLFPSSSFLFSFTSLLIVRRDIIALHDAIASDPVPFDYSLLALILPILVIIAVILAS